MNTNSGTARNRKNTSTTGTPGNKDATRPNRRSTRANGPAEMVEELEIIKGSKDGRKFLEERQLLVPAGRPLTMAMAGSCLHQVMESSPNVPQPVMQGLRALAYLMEDADQEEATQTYHDGFNSELEFFTSELTQLIKHTQLKVDAKLEELSQLTEDLTKSARTSDSQRRTTQQELSPAQGRSSYSQILAQPPASASPRMLARHGIRRRQLMLKGIRPDSSIGGLGDREIREKLNKILSATATDGVYLRSATKQRNGGLLVEFDSDYGAAWGRKEENIAQLCKAIGEGVETKRRTYHLIAKFVPLSAEPEDPNFIEEVEESNRMEAGVITSMRWAKAIERRKEHQKWAHIILTTDNVNEANRMIALGIYIANKKVTVEKCKIDPIRCLKCQGYNHYAKDCSASSDTCGQCGEKGHRTKECTSQKKYCVSCASEEHTSYDRLCPIFQKKASDKNLTTPENTLPFIPTDEPWTWSINPNIQSGMTRQSAGSEAPLVNPPRENQRTALRRNVLRQAEIEAIAAATPSPPSSSSPPPARSTGNTQPDNSEKVITPERWGDSPLEDGELPPPQITQS
ncbi:hypothetical protein CVT25_013228 [Psilocybe cyanescens]|uniref:CCHC-type domain-containing protein n=1 Tax=Psilocybe cyanescens TaxID=93625 RepID=A0A409X0N5_PSICY|nr:hypothetical protein CVT25_013182 [Psilocybe cyanescens]PPQ84291.1 hypothetical protein CVT25_013228 [Psilocybe cyanescens]